MVAHLDLYLASKSPRRRALLAEAGLRFVLCEPGEEYVDGSEHGCEVGDPRALCEQRARRKARGAATVGQRAPVLAVDTVVDLDGSELGKAKDRAAAETMLRRLAGSTHAVHTAHCLVAGGREFEETVTASVRCELVGDELLASYLDSGQWRGKAGAYGIQDDAQGFLELAAGPYDSVVGLHVAAVRRLLRRSAEVHDA
ncbi:MAG: Maf family protein [Planctomycetota bacterium]|nr:Maf family protein [Planctomycetota bacterium]